MFQKQIMMHGFLIATQAGIWKIKYMVLEPLALQELRLGHIQVLVLNVKDLLKLKTRNSIDKEEAPSKVNLG